MRAPNLFINILYGKHKLGIIEAYSQRVPVELPL